MRLLFRYFVISVFFLILGVSGVLMPIRNLVHKVVNPLQFGLYSIYGNLGSQVFFFSNLKSIRDDNLKLLEQVYRLESEVALLKELENENRVIREQFEGEFSRTGGVRQILARVTSRSFDNETSKIVVDIGMSSGVKEGDTVVFKNFLVGRVVKAFGEKAVVELLISPTFSVAGVDQSASSRASGIVTGRFATSLLMDRILPDEEIKVGDRVVTSGDDGLVRSGLIIGDVDAVFMEESGPIKKARLKTALNFEKLSLVFVEVAEE